MSPERRRRCVVHVRQTYGLSERRTCRFLGQQKVLWLELRLWAIPSGVGESLQRRGPGIARWSSGRRVLSEERGRGRGGRRMVGSTPRLAFLEAIM